MLRCGGNTIASTSRTLEVPLGFHKTLACDFEIPRAQNGALLEMVLSGLKKGVRQFEETRSFHIEEPSQESFGPQAVAIKLVEVP